MKIQKNKIRLNIFFFFFFFATATFYTFTAEVKSTHFCEYILFSYSSSAHKTF